MAISKIKFVTIVARLGAGNVDVEVNINGGSNGEPVTGQAIGAVKETLIPLDEPISIGDFTLDLFDLYVGAINNNSSWVVLESLYVIDASPGSAGQLILGIPNWPKTLRLGRGAQSITEGYMVESCNLGVIARMAN